MIAFALGLLTLAGPLPALAGSLGGYRAAAQAPRWTPQARGVFGAFVVKPTIARARLYDRLIRCEQGAGVWGRLGALHTLAAATEQAGLVNLARPSQVASISGTMTFVADRGLTGNGTTGTVATGIAISSIMSKDNGSVFVWSLTDVGAGARNDIGNSASSTIAMNSRNGSNQFVGGVNSAAVNGGAAATSVGLSQVSRADSANLTFAKNGAALGSVAQSSSTLGTGNLMYASSNGGSFSTRQLAVAGGGLSFSAAQATAHHVCLSAHLTGIGAL